MTIDEISNSISNSMKMKGANWSTMSNNLNTKAPNTTTIGTSFDYDTYAKFCEFELKGGNHVILKLHKSYIDDITSCSKYTINFTKKFPFISIQKQQYTSFSYNHVGLTGLYTIKLSLPKFMELVGIPYTSYDEIYLTDIIENG